MWEQDFQIHRSNFLSHLPLVFNLLKLFRQKLRGLILYGSTQKIPIYPEDSQN